VLDPVDSRWEGKLVDLGQGKLELVVGGNIVGSAEVGNNLVGLVEQGKLPYLVKYKAVEPFDIRVV
jgi:hypothetical protein